jgi:crotonobetainyl-CoA:carnitine CoA-transferase CaiB-like acyl-CoA transferase
MTADFRPLAGVRVLDFSHVIAGPLASFFLAQMGADVLKVENGRRGGDVMRRTPGGAAAFLALNAGKRIVEIDLGTEAGRDRALEEAGACEVLLDNLRPGVLQRFGLGYDAVRGINPRVVYCSVSGFGGAGPWAGRPAYDHVVQAATGMAMLGGREGDPPSKVGFPAVDAVAGLSAALAIVAALRERDRRDGPVHLDVPMSGAALLLMYSFACDALTTGATPKRVGNQAFSGSPAADIFETRDGWLAVGANTPRHLLALLKVLGLEQVVDDRTIFAVAPDSEAPAAFLTATDPARLKAHLRAALRDRDAAKLEQELAAAGVPAARVRTLGDFATEARDRDGVPLVRLEQDGTLVYSPGLGFRAR